jgi:hypothetical protein
MRVTVGRLEDDEAVDAGLDLENPQALDYVDYNLFAQQNPRHTRSRNCHPFLIPLSSRFGPENKASNAFCISSPPELILFLSHVNVWMAAATWGEERSTKSRIWPL